MRRRLPNRIAGTPFPPIQLLLLRLRRRRRLALIVFSAPFLVLASLHASSAVFRRANSLGRHCGAMAAQPPPSDRRWRIAMVSFAAKRGGGDAAAERSFGGLIASSAEKKRAYAAVMGYEFVDAGGLVDPRRPPSWSKIPAVRSLLPTHDWVFWNDADTIVTNPEIHLEHILLSAIGHDDIQSAPDLIVTEDVNGVNAGVFFVRQSKWSGDFLDTWWNQTTFIRTGSTRSGDNAALKHLIEGLPAEERRRHVRVASMQCLFNSYPWFPTWKSGYRLVLYPLTAWKGAYSEGDFMAHLAGIDDKEKWVARILKEMRV